VAAPSFSYAGTASTIAIGSGCRIFPKDPDDPIADDLLRRSENKKDADRKVRLYLEYVCELAPDEAKEMADKIAGFYEGCEI
jgi:hypothetical protein